jgi:hypothetical protein
MAGACTFSPTISFRVGGGLEFSAKMLGFHVRVSYLQTDAANFKQDKLNNWELEKTNANRNKVKQAQRQNYKVISEAKVRIKEVKKMETN